MRASAVSKVFLFSLFVLRLSSAGAYTAIEGATDSKVITPGVWNTNFTEALDYATKNHIPVLMYYGSTGCGYCSTMCSAINLPLFKDWIAEKPIVLIYKHPTPEQISMVLKASSAEKCADPDLYRARMWVKDTSASIPDYPRLRCWWEEEGGAVHNASFCGRDQSMPVKKPQGSTTDKLAEKLVATLNLYFSGYEPNPPYFGGEFSPESYWATNGITEFVALRLERGTDIKDNPAKIKFQEVEAAQLPSVLKDVDFALINANYALGAGLNPSKDALLVEGSSSAYVNIVCTKAGKENDPKIKALVAATESKQVKDFINKTYDGAVLPVVDNPTDGYDASIDYDALKGTSISIAASPTPHAEILAIVKGILAAKDITLNILEFSDYVQPNNVVESGEVDANYFQHVPYLEDFNAENGTHIVSVAGIHVEPFGVYPGKSKSLDVIAK